MNRHNCLKTMILSVLFLFLSISNQPLDAQTIHAVLIGDTHADRIGESCGKDIQNIVAMLSEGVAEDRLNIQVLTGYDVNNASVLAAIRNIPAYSNDSVFVYYSGHGAFSRDSKHHYFTFESETRWLSRKRILNEMQSLHPRLSVLISDCCANVLRRPAITLDSLNQPGEWRANPLLNSLFFESNGIVNLTSSRRGQVSLCTTDEGGMFTSSLVQVVSDHAFDRLSWEEVFHKARYSTSLKYHDYAVARYRANKRLDQYTQTAWSFASWNGRDMNGTRLGIEICDCGRHVLAVEPGSPADRAGITTGAELITYNGATIKSAEHLLRWIRESSLTANIEIKDQYGRRMLPTFHLEY